MPKLVQCNGCGYISTDMPKYSLPFLDLNNCTRIDEVHLCRDCATWLAQAFRYRQEAAALNNGG